jgi:hypothetical protein
MVKTLLLTSALIASTNIFTGIPHILRKEMSPIFKVLVSNRNARYAKTSRRYAFIYSVENKIIDSINSEFSHSNHIMLFEEYSPVSNLSGAIYDFQNGKYFYFYKYGDSAKLILNLPPYGTAESFYSFLLTEYKKDEFKDLKNKITGIRPAADDNSNMRIISINLCEKKDTNCSTYKENYFDYLSKINKISEQN